MSVHDEYIDLPDFGEDDGDEMPEGTMSFEATAAELRALDEPTLAFLVKWFGQMSRGLMQQVVVNFQLEGTKALATSGDAQALQATGTAIGFGMAFTELHALASRYLQVKTMDSVLAAVVKAAEEAGEDVPEEVLADDGDEVAYSTEVWLGRAPEGTPGGIHDLS